MRRVLPIGKARRTTRQVRAIDLFCGAGGSSWGAKQAGVEIVAGFDLWPLAGKTHHENFPNSQFIEGRLEEHDVAALVEKLGRIDLILASPECTSHSPAKGNKPRCEASKNTALEIIRFAHALQPRWIVIENVVSMRKWSRFEEFKACLEKEGYHVREEVLNAMNFRVPQSRRRLFLLCDRQRAPRKIRVLSRTPRPASAVVNLNGTYNWTRLYKKGRAKATLARARRALRFIGPRKPFLMVYYGSDAAGGWQTLEQPLRTITTLDRFAIVKCTRGRRLMRMLQVPELQVAMGMQNLRLDQGTRRDKIKLLGNAVCSPVMRCVVMQLTSVARSKCE